MRGVDPEMTDPEPTAAMSRLLHSLFELAKRAGNIDPPVKFLHSKIDATVRGLRDIPIGCRKGCSHCCHIWVSATAPEILYIAKIVRRRGESALARVNAAHIETKDYDFDVRDQHPFPCPMLNDNICSIYEFRPAACRMAASGDASICARSYRNLTDEDIPTPVLYLVGRSVYALALASALRHSQLPFTAYELNAGLARALERADAEQAWLSGNDIFSDVTRDPGDIFSERPAQMMYEYAFG